MNQNDKEIFWSAVGVLTLLTVSLIALLFLEAMSDKRQARVDSETYEAWVKYSKREDISYEEWYRLKDKNFLKP